MARERIVFEGYGDRLTVRNQKIDFEYLLNEGVFNVSFDEKNYSLKNAYTTFQTAENIIKSTDPIEKRWQIYDINDKLGKGKELTILFETPDENPRPKIHFSFYQGKPAFVIAAELENISEKEVELLAINLANCTDGNSGLSFGSALRKCKFLPNNWERTYGETYLRNISQRFSYNSPNSALFYDPTAKKTLLAGILEPSKTFTTFAVRTKSIKDNQLKFAVIQDVCIGTHPAKRGVSISKNKSFTAEKIIFIFGENPYKIMEDYADYVTRYNRITQWEKVPTGWCSWYYYLGNINEEEIIKNLDFIAKNLKPYGLEYILIDAGWQMHGNVSGGPWKPNPRFPRGMRWLAEEIHKKGLKAGIWVRPLEFDGMRFDASSTFVHKILEKEFQRLVNSEKYDYVKIDFLHIDAFTRRDSFLPEDNTITANEALRKVLLAIRKGIGPRTYLLGCNLTFGPALGIVNANRIGQDVDTNRWHTIKEYAVKSTAVRYHIHNKWWANDPDCLVVRPPMTMGQARSWASFIALTGGHTFAGDRMYTLQRERVDIVKKTLPSYGRTARPIDLFEKPLPEIWDLKIETEFMNWNVVGIFNWETTKKEIKEVRETTIEENLHRLKENDKDERRSRKLSTLEKIACSNPLIREENARIEKVMRKDKLGGIKLRLLQPIKRMYESTRFKNIVLSLNQLDIEPSQLYLIYDFWEDKFLGEYSESIKLLVKLADCKILAVHPAKDYPQILSTNRHITQGAVELKKTKWDSKKNILSGTSEIVANDNYIITLHVPQNYAFITVEAESSEKKAKVVSKNIVKIFFRTGTSRKIDWKLKFEKLE